MDHLKSELRGTNKDAHFPEEDSDECGFGQICSTEIHKERGQSGRGPHEKKVLYECPVEGKNLL